MSQKADHIIEFYGKTCPHCLTVSPIVEAVEKELGIQVRKLEVWDHDENHALMQKYEGIIAQACGGYAAVPSFVNTKTNQALCGVHDKNDLKILFEGGDCAGGVCKPHSRMPNK